MTDNLPELISKIDETLEYFYDEYPPDTCKHVWDLPVCMHVNGVTPNHLKQIKDILNEYANADKPPVKWQPIETAPRDGTTVLLWTVAKDGSWEDVAIQRVTNFDTPDYVATDWMPLPQPPEGTTMTDNQDALDALNYIWNLLEQNDAEHSAYRTIYDALDQTQGKVTGEPEGEIVVMEETSPKHKLDMVLVSDYFDGPFSIRVLTNNINKYLSEGYELYGYPFVWENGLAQVMIKKIKIEE